MLNEDSLLDILIDRLDHSGLAEGQQNLVLAAFEGDTELDEALTGGQDLERTREQATTEAAARTHGYLQAVTVHGFRGIGPQASLRLQPGPGLTVVVGRNGSGKSSFAEGVEAALTGTSYRWKGKTKEWQGGWHNLHEDGPAEVALELLLDGDRGRTTISRTWAGPDVNQSESWVQRPGSARTSLTSLGWDANLATYRPFLSYSELGQVIAGRPSDMYDALASILGLEQITDAEQRLNTARKDLESEAKQLSVELPALVHELESVDDDRARSAVALLKARRRDLAELAALAAGTQPEPAATSDLRRIAQLAPPPQERVAEVVAELRAAADAVAGTRGTVAEDSRVVADLLQRALDHHRRHVAQSTCPVCGTEGVLDRAWAERTRSEVDRLREEAGAAEAARAQSRRARTTARAVLAEPPNWLSADAPVRAAWDEWAAGETIDGPGELADHLERTLPPLHTACASAKEAAARELQELDDRWRPAALRLGRWVERAQAAEGKRSDLDDVKRAYNWLRDVGLDLRNDRLRPLAERSAQIWKQLRQESNVNLGPITLAGKATSRHVALDVTVDGIDGTALGVMSQGELHALALSLFLPRATVPDSPFRFLVIDDPVQSMDPAKVDGLARVLSQTAQDRQLIVFTHDTRLVDALRRLNLPATVWEVVRREKSVVELRKAGDPAERALDDARSLVRTDKLPAGVAARVVPGLCRSAVEAALVRLGRQRRLEAGARHADVEEEIRDSRGPYELASLAFFGDADRTADVLSRINSRYGRRAGDAFQASKAGGHTAYKGDLDDLVTNTDILVKRIRDEH